MENNQNYFAIIGAKVRYDKSLSSNHKVLYAEITALTQKNGYCFASNEHLSKIFDVHRNTISKWIGDLKKSGHIDYKIISKSDGNPERRIFLTDGKRYDLPPSTEGLTPLNPTVKPPKPRDEHNNINNNINNKGATAPASKKVYSDLVEKIFKDFTQKKKDLKILPVTQKDKAIHYGQERDWIKGQVDQGHTEDEIREIMRFGRTDGFWGKQTWSFSNFIKYKQAMSNE